jgi:hypothetical protein
MRALFLLRAVFLLLFWLLIYPAQRFWFLRAWRRAQKASSAGWRRILKGLTGCAAVVLLAALLDSINGNLIPRQSLAGWLVLVARVWVVASFVGFVALHAVRLLERLSRSAMRAVPVAARETFDPARRNFFRFAAYAAGSLPMVAGIYGFGAERFRYSVEQVEIPIAGLPQGLQGLRIVHLSDIHHGEFMPRSELRRAVEMANQLRPDLMVVTGDLVTDGHDPLEDCVAELSRLRAPLGVWGCNGNHEIYAEVEDLAQELYRQHGMHLLRQESAELEWRGARFNLIGVDYQRERTRTGQRALMLRDIEGLVRSDVPNILLSHNPNSFPRAAQMGIELSLAGHTHGGQVRVEIVDHDWSPARFMTDFIAGQYRLPLGGNSASAGRSSAILYVNRGLGTLGVPVRLGAPPEITLLTLRAA